MFGFGLPELIVLIVIMGIPLGAVLLFVFIFYNSRKKAMKNVVSNNEGTVVYCSKCGNEILEGSNYCHYCGEKQSGDGMTA